MSVFGAKWTCLSSRISTIARSAEACHRLFGWIIAPKTLETSRRQLSVAHRVLYRLVSQIALDRARIDALIGQLVTTSMAQHVRVDFHIEARCLSRAFDHCLKTGVRVPARSPR